MVSDSASDLAFEGARDRVRSVRWSGSGEVRWSSDVSRNLFAREERPPTAFPLPLAKEREPDPSMTSTGEGEREFARAICAPGLGASSGEWRRSDDWEAGEWEGERGGVPAYLESIPTCTTN